MNHSVYTRCKYATDREVEQRLALSQRYTIPAMIAAQREAEPVKWVWLCHPRHELLIESRLRACGWLGEIGFNEMRVTTYRETSFTARLGILARSGDEQIQTALDSDDWIHPQWLKQVQRHLRPTKKPYVVYWHPWRYEVATGKWYRPGRIAKWCSMFYSVYNPTDSYHVYVASHNKLQTLSGLSVAADPREGFCSLVVHRDNLHTTIKPTDVEIPTPNAFVDK